MYISTEHGVGLGVLTALFYGIWFVQVVFQADFTGANLNDTLMDRAVMNEAILRDAQLQRAVLTRSEVLHHFKRAH